MTDHPAKILLIEDDTRLAATLSQGLEEEGYAVITAANGEDGYFLYSQHGPDLVLLDLNLPGRDGIDILEAIRRQNRDTPVLILSARDTINDRVLGLDTGADDYLMKPFAFPELLARIRVRQRRNHEATMMSLTIADLHIDLIHRQVSRQGEAIKLTPKEYELLDILVRNHDRVVSRETIARDVWKVQRATPLDNVIDVHIMHLRKKIDADYDPPLLHTIRGMGFMISEQPHPA